MKFKHAYNYLKGGQDIKLPEWKGFWRWCDEKNTIMIHLADGGVVDIRDTDDLDYTLSFVLFREDWMVLDKPNKIEYAVTTLCIPSYAGETFISVPHIKPLTVNSDMYNKLKEIVFGESGIPKEMLKDGN